MGALAARQQSGGKLQLLLVVLIILAPSQWQIFGTNQPKGSSSGGGGGARVVAASYLDQVGQLTQVMNEFVEALLEKVSFLATIVIESSLAEECTAPIGGPKEEPTGGAGRREKCLKLMDSMHLSGAKDGHHSNQKLDRSMFDELEFKNLNHFVGAYNKQLLSGQRNGTTGSGLGGGGCKMFSLEVNPSDLPVGAMELCCAHFSGCYATCGRPKLSCDEQFRDCLRQMCRNEFDYNNATVVRRQRRLERRRAPLFSGIEPMAAELDESDDLEPVEEGEESEGAAAAAAEEEEQEEGAQSGPEVEAASAELKPMEAEEERLYEELDSERKRKRQTSGDEQMSRTGKRLRSKYKACKLASKMLIIGNLAFGCQHYKELQVRACCAT